MSHDMPLLVLAHAKINLSLRVLARETSGYHQLETVFCSVELADEIEISRTTAGITLEIRQAPEERTPLPDLGPHEQNLAYRAAALFNRHAPIAGGIHIRLTKRIPAGAGLGGGSSDAAAVLRALNALHATPLSDSTLLELGAQLGSDVAFFVTAAPLALAWGRGERVMPLPPLPAAPILLAVSPDRVSTADAYAALNPHRSPIPRVVKPPSSWREAAADAQNDFENVVFDLHPRLRALRQAVEDSGALLARMTGSGSVVFGVFENVAAAEHAAGAVAGMVPEVATIVTQSRTGGTA